MHRLKLFSNLCICYIFLDITNFLGVLDAVDGREYKRQSGGFQCIFPSYPDNGNWTVLNRIRKPGDAVGIISVEIEFQCNHGYILTPDLPYHKCDEDKWKPQLMPKCLKSCPPLYSTSAMSVRCQDVTGNEISCAQSTDGTYFTYQCEPFHEALEKRRSHYCSNGTWDYQPICEPVCGKKINHSTSLRSIQVDTTKIEYPWVVAIFMKYNGKFVNSCGGSLITTRMILTAAHCVSIYDQVQDKNSIQVAAGKYYGGYGDTRDIHAQYREVAELIVHEQFRGGETSYQYDIALIVTKGSFMLGPAVKPVCIDFNNSFHPHVGDHGEIARWGLTKDYFPTDHLKNLIIPYKDQTTCSRELPSDFAARYNSDDKICGGYFEQNETVCRGGSGSGLTFRNPDDNRYYVHGLASTAPRQNSFGLCQGQGNILYTKVAKYYQWIDENKKKNSVEKCTLPSFPGNGTWRIEFDGEKRPGDMVPFNTILVFSCNEGYKLSSSQHRVECASLAHLPSCNLICTNLSLSSAIGVSCSDSKQQNIDCADAVSGSSMSYSCLDGYETEINMTTDEIYCIDGSWSKPNPKCNPKKRSSYPVTLRGNISETSTSPNNCFLPDFPKNGLWVLLGGEKRPGDSVPTSTVLRFECFQGYELSSSPYVVCDKHWSSDFPECRKLCPPRYSTSTTTFTCRDKDGYKISCSEATDGTLLTYQCTDNVIYESNMKRKTFYCVEGDWEYGKPECVPVCGVRNVNAKPMSFRTSFTKLYEFPWVTAIYMKVNSTMMNVCGGTLITSRIVLTAAHCAFNEQERTPTENMEIATGKQYLDYGDSRDTKAQYRKVSSIILKNEFNAKRLQLYDIALFVAEKKFDLGPEIQPACYDDIPLPPVGTTGEIAGWGKTEEGVQPDHLKTLKIIHKDQTICGNEFPKDFADKYFLHDKMCAGFSRQNRSLCHGDSGSGLVFSNPRDNDRYYVQGIVSVAPPSDDNACNYKDNSLLTMVSVYHQWIEEEVRIIERCKLPPYPKNGRWKLENGDERSPGQTVLSPTTILVFSCNNGYILDSLDSKYYCQSPMFPTCESEK